MAKTINFEYDGISYTLEYTRRTVKMMEDSGFNPATVKDRIVGGLLDLFKGSFLAHHRATKDAVKEEIFDHMPNREELFNALIDMYNEPMEKMMDDPEDTKGNVKWTVG